MLANVTFDSSVTGRRNKPFSRQSIGAKHFSNPSTQLNSIKQTNSSFLKYKGGKEEPIMNQSMAESGGWTTPFSRGPSAKFEDESKDEEEFSDGSWFGSENNKRPSSSSSPNKRKRRGPGRPRKPDHLLVRPRRSYGHDRNGGSIRRNPPQESTKLVKTVERIPRLMTELGFARAKADVPKGRSMEDQALITAQQQQIEKMQEQLRQYEAKIKALSTHRLDSTPPTPATSINQSSLYTHHAPPRNPPIPSGNNLYHHTEYDMNGLVTSAEREDSPLSVYSDLNLSDILDDNQEWKEENKQGNNDPVRRSLTMYSRREREILHKPSLVVVFKGNFGGVDGYNYRYGERKRSRETVVTGARKLEEEEFKMPSTRMLSNEGQRGYRFS